eukprot:g647.t2
MVDGRRQALSAKEVIVNELPELKELMEDPDASSGLETLVVASNLLRAVHTAVLLNPNPEPSQVLVHPSLRERILDDRDEPSELNHLREWLIDRHYDAKVDLSLYEQELIQAGAASSDVGNPLDLQDPAKLHEIYLKRRPIRAFLAPGQEPTWCDLKHSCSSPRSTNANGRAIPAVLAGSVGRAMWRACWLTAAAALPPSEQVVFQPSEGLRSGREFETSLKLCSEEGWATERVSLLVPEGIRLVRPSSKPGWAFRWEGSTLQFEDAKGWAESPFSGALEFQLHLAAGCDFPNASEAFIHEGRRALLWRTSQLSRGANGTERTNHSGAFLAVSSDRACAATPRTSPGMRWLNEHIPAVKEVSAVRNGRHGVHGGMAFGRFPHAAQRAAQQVPVWKVLALLVLVLLTLLASALLMGFVASTWARALVSTSRQALLKEHTETPRHAGCAGGEEEAAGCLGPAFGDEKSPMSLVCRCRSLDLRDDSWNAKQNKEMLQKRAESFTQWLEEHACPVLVLVGHACFLGMITGDKEPCQALKASFINTLTPKNAMRAVSGTRRTAAASAALSLQKGFENVKALPFSEMPGPQWPVVGALPAFMSYGFSRLHESYEKYGLIWNGSIMNEPTVILSEPREMRKQEGRYPRGLVSDAWFLHHMNAKLKLPGSKLIEDEWWGRVLDRDGPNWHSSRQKLQKDIFGVATASSYCEPVTQAAEMVMESLEQRTRSGQQVDLRDLIVNAVADVFTAAMLGRPLGVSAGRATEEEQPRMCAGEQQWVENGMKSIGLTAQLTLQPHLKLWPEASATYRELERREVSMRKTTKDLVFETLARYENYEGPEEDLPYVVRVWRRKEFSEEDFPMEVHGIVLAGLDTTYHILLWNMLNLGRFPEAQEHGLGALRTHARASVTGKEEDHGRSSFSAPAPVFSIRFAEEDMTLCGYEVPKNCRIVMTSEGLQNDPQLVDEPEKFLPERFLPDQVQARKNDAWDVGGPGGGVRAFDQLRSAEDPLKSILDHKLLSGPFSFGPRMCMGARLADMEIMTLMAKRGSVSPSAPDGLPFASLAGTHEQIPLEALCWSGHDEISIAGEAPIATSRCGSLAVEAQPTAFFSGPAGLGQEVQNGSLTDPGRRSDRTAGTRRSHGRQCHPPRGGSYLRARGERSVRMVLYFMGLIYSFMGVSIVADLFMSAIERVTSVQRCVQIGTSKRFRTAPVWNETVATLTLMALGSSAPEIMLSLNDIVKRTFVQGKLGASTIVGSAAFNLFVIVAVCINTIPAGTGQTTRQHVEQLNVARFRTEVEELESSIDGSTAALALALSNFAAALGASGEEDEALEAYFRAKQAHEAAGSTSTPSYADARNGDVALNVGDHLNEQGQPAEAQELFLRAKEVYLKEAGGFLDHPTPGLRAVSGESRQIKQRGVYAITAFFSIFAYVWLLFICVVSSIDEIELWEGMVTFSYFPIFVTICYLADIGVLTIENLRSKLCPKRYDEEADNAPKTWLEKFKVENFREEDLDPEEKRRREEEEKKREAARMAKEREMGMNLKSGHLTRRQRILRACCRRRQDPAQLEEDVEVPLEEEEHNTYLSDPNIPLLDDDGNPLENEYGIITFSQHSVTIRAKNEVQNIPVEIVRKNGNEGKVTCTYRLEQLSAIPGFDYEEDEGEIQFRDGVQTAEISLTILPKKRGERSDRFQFATQEPTGGAEFNPDFDGGEECQRLTIVVENEIRGGSCFTALIDAVVNLDELRQGTSLWKAQILEVIFVGGSKEEQDRGGWRMGLGNARWADQAGALDWLNHLIWLPWTLIFALFTPPPAYLGGWVCFFISLMHIAWLTIIIGDLAELFGCVANVDDNITAISFVALGTSVPDRSGFAFAPALHRCFASRGEGGVERARSAGDWHRNASASCVFEVFEVYWK